MLTVEKRRRIARKFIEKNFGKYPVLITRYSYEKDINNPFELWVEPDEVSFQVIHAPYVHRAGKAFIAVSDSKEELDESINRNFDKERVAAGCVEYEKEGEYFIAYD